MNRRAFLARLGSAVAWPVVAHGQQSAERKRRVGVLTGYSERDAQGAARLMAFVQALGKLGWTEGRNLEIDNRWGTPDSDVFAANLAALASREPDVILANSTPVVAATQRQANRIPIVFVQVSDPVGEGLVANLARPGGNLTGFMNFDYAIGTKWLELLKEVAPGLTRFAIVFNPETAAGRGYNWVRPIEAAARLLALETVVAPVRNAAEIGSTLDDFGRRPNGGVIVVTDPSISALRDVIVTAAVRNRLPSIYPFSFYTRAGGLLSYGLDVNEMFAQAAVYVSRLLHGAKPADLPVQAPNKFELVINLKTAKAIDLIVPPSLLARADEVIE